MYEMPGPDGERPKGCPGIRDIIKFQILMTPGLVIDGQVKAAGRIPTVEEIKQMLLAAGGN